VGPVYWSFICKRGINRELEMRRRGDKDRNEKMNISKKVFIDLNPY